MRDYHLYSGRYIDAYKAGMLHLNSPVVPDELLDYLKRCEKQLNILDIGCGEGFTSRTAAEMGHNVIGVDISGYALKRAITLNRHHNVKYMEGDITECSFDLVFDLVLDIGCTHLIGDQEQRLSVYRLVASLLQPDGLFFFIAGTVSPRYTPTHSVYRFYDSKGNENEVWLSPVVGGCRQSADLWIAELTTANLRVIKWNSASNGELCRREVHVWCSP